MRRLMITLGALFVLAACDGQSQVGGECQGGAVDNDCVEGAVCTIARSNSAVPPSDPNNERYYCRTICDLDANCPADFECRQVAGTMLRSCQPRDDGSSSTDAGM